MVEAFARGDHSKLGVLVRQITSMQVDGAGLADTGLGVLFSDGRFLQALVDAAAGWSPLWKIVFAGGGSSGAWRILGPCGGPYTRWAA